MTRPSPRSARFLLLFVSALALVALLGDAATAHVFSFRAPAGARLVSVAGTFNQWSTTAHPLRDPDGDGVWTADVPIPAGRHLYKFVVNGMDWHADPAATKEDDGMGGFNSVLGSAGAVAAPAASGAACLGCPLHCPPGAHAARPSASTTPAPAVAPAAPARPAASPAASPAAAPAATGAAPTFSYRAPAGTRSVAAAGSFNNWSSSATPLTDPDGDGVWTATVRLAPGSYQYKFVINGSDWREDPANPKKTDDGLGGTNSVLDVTAAGTSAAPAAAATRPAASSTPAAPAAGGPTFSYRAPAGTRSVAAAGSFNNWSSSATPLTDPDGDGVWTATVRLAPGSYQYKFVVNGSDWREDPANPKKTDDGLGGTNSVLDVTAAGTSAAPAASSSPSAPAAPAGGNGMTTFSYRAPAGTRSVAVAGSFNNWSSSANMLTAGADGVFTGSFRLAPGSYQYKFVINGSDWKEDPANPKKADDGLGGSNSVIDVTASGGANTGAAAPAASAAAPAAAPAGGNGMTSFTFRAPAGTRSVAVAGSFNGWNMNANPLTDPDRDGVWTASMRIAPGRHQYKFVVNGSDWIEDPGNPQKADDGSGNINSIIDVTAAGGSNTGAAGGAAPSTSAAAPAGGNGMTTFSYRAPAGTRSVAVAGAFNNWSATANMLTAGADGVFTGSFRLAPGSYQYKFVINGSDWKEDPANPKKADDGLGGSNSVIDVTASGGANTGATAGTGGAAAAPAAAGGGAFSFRAPAGTRSVAVAGSFNGWSSTATMLTDPDGDGVWTSSYRPAPGTHQYKFVINGTDWIIDPGNPQKADDGFGGQNSVLQVSLAPPGSPGGGLAGGPEMVEFAFRSLPGTRSVALAGTFNNWSARARQLADADNDGTWTTQLELTPGLHDYKFVINGLDWIRDPGNPHTVPDGAGGLNSVVAVGAAARRALATANAHAPPADRGVSDAARDLWAIEPLHRFSFRPAAGAGTGGEAVTSVAVAGSFNNWSTTSTPMSDADGDGEWTTELKLPDGVVRYKFVVNGRQWIKDPGNARTEPDGVGGENSLVERGAATAPDRDSARGDGDVDGEAIAHGPDARWVVRTSADSVVVTLRVDRDDVERAAVVVESRPIPLTLFTRDGRYEYWRGAFSAPSGSARYWFTVEDGGQRFVVDRGGLRAATEPVSRPFEPAVLPVFATPVWARRGVVYHVFPDRFANGDPGNDPAGRTRPWVTEPLPKSPQGWDAVYGGDLDGVTSRLDYLADLGVTAVKFNPIFAAPSNAKYDWVALDRIDESFGGNAAFDRLLSAAKARGIRVILDGVFNHSGDQHAYFRDAVARGPESPYYAWYNILKWPFPDRFEGQGPNAPANWYECWWGFGQLPAWNTRREDVRAYLIGAAEDWTRRGIGGWRLDAANEVEAEFWQEFRRRIKAADPDQYLVGEIWENAADWLQGDQFDATMNYELRGAILDFFVERKIDAEAFANRVGRLGIAVPAPVRAVMYNHISSHDVPRVRTLAGGDRDRARQAAEFQFASAGLPVIYYGDEVGMEGENDPDNRRAFPWSESEQDLELRDQYRRLARLRAEEPLLAAPSWIPLHASGRVLVAMVRDGRRAMLQVFNAGDEPADVVLGLGEGGPTAVPAGSYRDLLGGGMIAVAGNDLILPRLEPRSTAYYVKVTP